ncbi:MAG: hypothetical protein MI862_26515 [Desulfobacterales bacterium]|nr:hypothetical protein [Desulfobacterales bacterium]
MRRRLKSTGNKFLDAFLSGFGLAPKPRRRKLFKKKPGKRALKGPADILGFFPKPRGKKKSHDSKWGI